MPGTPGICHYALTRTTVTLWGLQTEPLVISRSHSLTVADVSSRFEPSQALFIRSSNSVFKADTPLVFALTTGSSIVLPSGEELKLANALTTVWVHGLQDRFAARKDYLFDQFNTVGEFREDIWKDAWFERAGVLRGIKEVCLGPEQMVLSFSRPFADTDMLPREQRKKVEATGRHGYSSDEYARIPFPEQGVRPISASAPWSAFLRVLKEEPTDFSVFLSLPPSLRRASPHTLSAPCAVTLCAPQARTPSSAETYWMHVCMSTSGFALMSPFRFCNACDLVTCQTVCRSWYHVLSSEHTEHLWQHVCGRWGLPKIGDMTWRLSCSAYCAVFGAYLREREESREKEAGERGKHPLEDVLKQVLEEDGPIQVS